MDLFEKGGVLLIVGELLDIVAALIAIGMTVGHVQNPPMWMWGILVASGMFMVAGLAMFVAGTISDHRA